MLTSQEFNELVADYQINPWPLDVLNVNIARLLAAFLNTNRKKGRRPVDAYDFLPANLRPEKETIDDPTSIFEHIKKAVAGGVARKGAAPVALTKKDL